MQVQQKSLTTAKSAKDYLSKNEIPQLFECLMTGLMYHRPIDYIDYLQSCLEKIKKQGVNAVHWDMFLEAKKTPLPPIAPAPKEDFRPEPLPEIGSFQLKIPADSLVVVIQGGPGIGKFDICEKLSSNFQEFVHIQLGMLIRDRALLESRDNSSKWKGVFNSINEGEFAPDDLVLDVLIKELNKHDNKKHFLIDGYPRTTQERQDFEKFIGFSRLKMMILIDCEEEVCQRNLRSKTKTKDWKDVSSKAITNKIANYKANTLAVCKYIDDQGKLKVIDGDRDADLVYKDILDVFSREAKESSCSPKPSSPAEMTEVASFSPLNQPAAEDIPELVGISAEVQRNPELPQCTFVLILGGPGCGKTEIASYISQRIKGWVHIDMNEILRSQVLNSDSPNYQIGQRMDGIGENAHFVENLIIQIEGLKNKLMSVDPNTQVVLIEGFPRNEIELNQLNTEIGNINHVILLDSEEEVMKSRLHERFLRLGLREDNEANSLPRIQYFKENGLPICRYFDERCQLDIISADQDTLYIVDEIARIFNIPNESIVEQREDEQEEIPPLYNENASNAAITIQATIRGHLTRKHLKESRSREDTEKVNQKSEINSTVIDEHEPDQQISNEDETVDDKTINEDEETRDDIEDMPNDAENEEDENIDQEVTENNEQEIEEIAKSDHESIENDENLKNDNENMENNETVVEEEPQENVEENILPEEAHPTGFRGVRTQSQLELNEANIILLLGGPGSGKKTLGDHLVIKYSVSFVHVDQLISSEINSSSDSAEALNQCIESNYDDITPILTLLRKTLVQNMTVSKHIVVAGFPKTLNQYQRFIDEVASVAAVVYLDVDSDTMQKRLEAETDPDFSTSAGDQVKDFQDKNISLLEELSKMDIFYQISGNGNAEQVLELASNVFEQFSFMQREE